MKRVRSQSVCSQPTTESPFRVLKLSAIIPLPPYYIGKERQGIETVLNHKLLKYDAKLQGVLLAYSGLKTVESRGRVFNEQPELQYLVSMRALVFSTPQGMVLNGLINTVTAGHISLLVLDAFPVTIAAEELRLQYDYKPARSIWVPKANGKDHDIADLEIGKVITFHVVNVDAKDGMIIGTIPGNTAPTALEGKVDMPTKKSKKKKKKMRQAND